MRTKEYNALFRDLAEKHKDLKHSKTNMRFVRMTLSSDPIQRVLDLTEFNNSIKNKIKKGFFLLLQNYEVGYGENGGDRTSKQYYGAFLILSNVDPNDVDAQEEAYDESERIGEEIMAAAIHRFNNYGGVPLKRISANDVSNDRVAKVALQYFGTRFDFAFSMAANKSLKYNPDLFHG